MNRFQVWRVGPGLGILYSAALLTAGRADAPSSPASKPPGTGAQKAVEKPAESEAQKAQRARQMVDAFLEALQAKGGGDVAPIHEEVLTRLFPDVFFFAVRYPLHPTPILPPAPLRFANVIAVPDSGATGQSGQFQILTDTSKLLTFFTGVIPPQKTPEGRMDATRAWLRLSEELAEDGPYAFSIPVIKVAPGKDGDEVSAKAVVTTGGAGKIEVALYFDAAGHVTSVSSACSVARSRP